VFDGTTDPLLDARISHHFPDLLLRVDMRSRVSKLERPTFSSDAGFYTENQLFSFFLGSEPGGGASSQASSQTPDVAGGAVAGIVTRWATGQFGSELNKVLPIDTLSCEPDPTATTVTIGSCTVGTRIFEHLFISYRRRLQPRVDENTGDVDVQLRMGDRLLFEGTAGDRVVLGADLLWRHRW
jgi:hypothetical protein